MLNGKKDLGLLSSDHDLFLEAFEKPTQIYKLLSYRHQNSPAFLTRNLMYMQHRRGKKTSKRCKKVETIVNKLTENASKSIPNDWGNVRTSIAIKSIDNKGKTVNDLQTYDIEIHLMKLGANKEKKSNSNSGDTCIKKFTFVPSAKKKRVEQIDIEGTLLQKYLSSRGALLEFRVNMQTSKHSTSSSTDSKNSKDWCSGNMMLMQSSFPENGSYTLYLYPIYEDEGEVEGRMSWFEVGDEPEERYLNEVLKENALEDTTVFSSITFSLNTVGYSYDVRAPKLGASGNTNLLRNALLYNFIYNGSTQQQTECRRTMICPWCDLNCKTIYPLLEHITRCHPRFKVTYVPGLYGFSELDIEINERQYISHFRQPDEILFPSCDGPKKRPPFSLVLNKRSKKARTVQDFMVLDIAPYEKPHNRLYFHSNSCQPINPTEMGYDSDNEDNMYWVSDETKKMIKDFTDVNQGEKDVMIMWNCFILDKRPFADHLVPSIVEEFCKVKGKELVERNLIKNFTLHLANLQSYNLIKPCELEQAVLFLYSLEDNSVANGNGHVTPTSKEQSPSDRNEQQL